MVAGIEFHRGTRKLELGKKEINEAVQFPDDFKFSHLREEKKFLKNVIDDVTRFGEKVDKTTKRIYEEATDRIAKWVLREPQPLSVPLSVFSPKDPVGTLRTALVQCNFTDVSRLITDFRYRLLDSDGEERDVSDLVITEANSIPGVMDQITAKGKSADPSLLVLIIRQFESLNPSFLDSLISLIFSNSTARRLIPRLRLVVCLSTSPAFFDQTCSMDTLNLLNIEQFQFTKLDAIFDTIISTGIHSRFQPPRPKPKSIVEDDPSLLNSDDCAPGVFSGQFLKYLKDRFFSCDYSITALVRAVQFAFLQHYFRDPLWREDPNEAPLRKYDVVLEAFRREFWLDSETNLHIEVQSDERFWSGFLEKQDFLERKQFLISGKNLDAFVKRIREDILKVDEEWCEKLDSLMDGLQKAHLNPTVASASEEASEAVATPKKMTLAELQKQQKMKIAAKAANPVKMAKSAVFGHVMNLFESTLRPYPSTWRNVIGGHTWTLNHVKTSLDASDEADIEKCLLETSDHRNLPISRAWRALLCHRKFKTVPIADWARDFLSESQKINKKEKIDTEKGAFFASAGQLESIGLIRGAADRRATTVNVQYHPINCVPDF